MSESKDENIEVGVPESVERSESEVSEGAMMRVRDGSAMQKGLAGWHVFYICPVPIAELLTEMSKSARKVQGPQSVCNRLVASLSVIEYCIQ